MTSNTLMGLAGNDVIYGGSQLYHLWWIGDDIIDLQNKII